VITTAELHHMAEKEGLRFDQAEKDYIILWLLSGLVQSGAKEHGWVFKGGTCLRHCYYEGYRFSEDVDFSCRPGLDNLETSLRLLDSVARWVAGESGVRLTIREPSTVPGDFQMEIPVEYNRGGARRQGLPQVKVHLTFDEPILHQTVDRRVVPSCSDLSPFTITAYSLEEILAEKLRSLLQQQAKWPRPRDLYDLWYILCQSGEFPLWQEVEPLFVEKCRVRGLAPDVAGLTSEALREWNQAAWLHRLGPMLKELPDFEGVWPHWVRTFRAWTEATASG
jgi:predicted nucleotidyltransferase component of viral defense system